MHRADSGGLAELVREHTTDEPFTCLGTRLTTEGVEARAELVHLPTPHSLERLWTII